MDAAKCQDDVSVKLSSVYLSGGLSKTAVLRPFSNSIQAQQSALCCDLKGTNSIQVKSRSAHERQQRGLSFTIVAQSG